LQFESLPTYSVKELNDSIGSLLRRGFAPGFLLRASVSKSQLKRGHLWMTFTDGKASIDGVVWSSQLSKIKFRPKEEDGVLIFGKLNFWSAQARLSINVLDIRASLSTVLKKFEVVRELLIKDGLINDQRQRELPKIPSCIAVLTSIPSSALADILRTAKERWPLTKLVLIPIPVQGEVVLKLQLILKKLSNLYLQYGIEVIVLARGGGSREDLMLFDDEKICRELAHFPIPIVTGIGHEDDLTVADLVADHRASTPTAAIVDLLPSREIALSECIEKKRRLFDYLNWIIRYQRNNLMNRLNHFKSYSPLSLIKKNRIELLQRSKLLNASSPQHLLGRGFCIATNQQGELIKSVKELELKKNIHIEFKDGNIDANIENVNHDVN
tara:strand:+ start:145 stop:1296 length:1152 start_codon:yes stop_codon:yes gene_type:complete